MKNALMTGATGFLGRQVVKAFEKAGYDVQGTGFSRAQAPLLKLDLTNDAATLKVLDEAAPDVIIHCAANRFVNKCIEDPEAAKRLNVESTRTLARAATSRNIVLIYISTDYVFSGKKGEAPYEVDALAGPTNIYGETKLAGEKALLEETKASGMGIVLRVPVLYGPTDDPHESTINEIFEVVSSAQEKGFATSVDDWAQRFPTNTEDVARVCKDIAGRYLEARDAGKMNTLPKVLQFSSEDRFTKYQILQLFGEIMGLPLEGISPQKPDLSADTGTQRPYDSQLSTKVLKDLGIPVWTQDFEAWWYVASTLTRLTDLLLNDKRRLQIRAYRH
ncbi:hypothetical protein MMC25_008007 [Agyrium rufum]|nr:hypothetical protein [Agyrium rufum]